MPDPDWLVQARSKGLIITEGLRVNLPSPAPIAPQSENTFQAEVLALAKRNGWLCYHTHDSRKSEPGFPDLVLVRGPVLLLKELKVPPNTPSAAQRTWLEALVEVQQVESGIWVPAQWNEIARTLR